MLIATNIAHPGNMVPVIVRHAVTGEPPADPVADAGAAAVLDLLEGARVDLDFRPAGTPSPSTTFEPARASATGAGPPGWDLTVTVTLDERAAGLAGTSDRTGLGDLLHTVPDAVVRAATQLRHHAATGAPVTPAIRRAVRDTVATEILSSYLRSRVSTLRDGLVGETIDYLIELSGTRVESHDLTHGVVVADVLQDTPRLQFAYPADVRAAKRAPLLFDGQQALLLVDPSGRARRELQRHRFERLIPTSGLPSLATTDYGASGSLVAAATRRLGGVGFFLRADRSIWTFVDGRPLLVRRREHWTAFPLELTAAIANMIGGGSVAALVTQTALMISARPGGAILAIVGDSSDLDGVVSFKDRYDLRNEIDPMAMQFETRLHHLIDADDLDELTLVRLAMLDGATVLDRAGRLLAYGAIVSSADSEHEGARTAAAKTLSKTALVVLKVSIDGDITIFRAGTAVATLLGRPTESRRV